VRLWQRTAQEWCAVVRATLLASAIMLTGSGCAPSDPLPAFDVSDPGGEMILTSSKPVVSVSAFRVGGDVCGPSAKRPPSESEKLVELQLDGSTPAKPPVTISLAHPSPEWRVAFQNQSGQAPGATDSYFVVTYASGSEGRLCKPL
jgi:hypothetical protein